MNLARLAPLGLALVVLASGPGRAQDEDEEKKPAKPAEPPVVAATSEAVSHALDTTKLDLQLDAVPLIAALAGQGERLQVLVAIDPAVRAAAAKDTLQAGPVEAKQASGRAILNLLLGAAPDVGFEVFRGSVFVTSKSSPAKVPPAPELTDAAKKLWGKTVDLDFADAPLADAVAALAKRSGLALEVGAKAQGKVTLAAKSFPVGQALEIVCRLLGLKVVRAGEKLELRPREPRDKSAPPEAAAVAEAKKSAAESRKANEALEKQLQEKKVGLDFDEADLSEVLEHIQEKSGLSFVIDKAVDQTKKVTASANEISVKDALGKVLTSLGYVAEAKDGVLVIRPR